MADENVGVGTQVFTGTEAIEVLQEIAQQIAWAPKGSHRAMKQTLGFKLVCKPKGLVVDEGIFAVKNEGTVEVYDTSVGEVISEYPPDKTVFYSRLMTGLVVEVRQIDAGQGKTRTVWHLSRQVHEGPEEGVLIYRGEPDYSLEMRP